MTQYSHKSNLIESTVLVGAVWVSSQCSGWYAHLPIDIVVLDGWLNT